MDTRWSGLANGRTSPWVPTGAPVSPQIPLLQASLQHPPLRWPGQRSPLRASKARRGLVPPKFPISQHSHGLVTKQALSNLCWAGLSGTVALGDVSVPSRSSTLLQTPLAAWKSSQKIEMLPLL